MRRYLCLLALGLLCMVISAQASTFVLTFQGLQDSEPILQYYNAGFGGFGSGPGPNYGITFGADSLALISSDDGGSGNFSMAPGGDTIAFFLSGSGDILDRPGGFDTGFSFYYASPYFVGDVTVWSGLDGTGQMLLDIPLPETQAFCDPNHDYSCWVAAGGTFTGTAESVVFSGTADNIGFSLITVGSGIPGTPEPGTLVMFGSGVLGLAGWLRRKVIL